MTRRAAAPSRGSCVGRDPGVGGRLGPRGAGGGRAEGQREADAGAVELGVARAPRDARAACVGGALRGVDGGLGLGVNVVVDGRDKSPEFGVSLSSLVGAGTVSYVCTDERRRRRRWL